MLDNSSEQLLAFSLHLKRHEMEVIVLILCCLASSIRLGGLFTII
jgi:hypothetical protein